MKQMGIPWGFALEIGSQKNNLTYQAPNTAFTRVRSRLDEAVDV